MRLRTALLLLLAAVPQLVPAQVAGHNVIHWPQPHQYTVSKDIIAIGNDGIVEMRGVFNADNFALFRVDSAGNPLWHKEIICTDTFGMLFPGQMVALNNGTFLVTGLAENWNYNTQNGIFTMCYDTSGTLLWKKIYNINAYCSYAPVTIYSPLDSGYVYYAMHCISSTLPNPPGNIILKTDLNGVLLDTTLVHLQGYGVHISAGVMSSNGNLIFAGGDDTYIGFLSIDTSLQVITSRIISGFLYGTSVTGIAECAGGNFMIATYSPVDQRTLWFRVNNTGHVLYYTQLLAGNWPPYQVSGLKSTSTGDMYAIMRTDNAGLYAGTQLAHFDDTGGVAHTAYLYGSDARALVLCNDLPVIGLRVYAANTYPIAYVQTDTTCSLFCNSSNYFINCTTSLTITEAVPAPVYPGMMPVSLYTFSDSTVTTTTFSVSDYCLFNTIAEEPAREIDLWPVPSTTVLNVRNARPGAQVSIYDVFGKLLLNESCANGVINISNLAAGYYVAVISEDAGQAVRLPFIKQ